jgi:hypothetical protein
LQSETLRDSGAIKTCFCVVEEGEDPEKDKKNDKNKMLVVGSNAEAAASKAARNYKDVSATHVLKPQKVLSLDRLARTLGDATLVVA